MASLDEQILRTAKEIVVKFIEVGRISPTGFDEAFKNIYQTVDSAVRQSHAPKPQGDQNKPDER